MYGQCKRSADCLFGLFCNDEGFCVPTFNANHRCTSNDDCGRESLCRFDTPNDAFGNCTTIVSLDVEALVLPEVNKAYVM